MMNTNKIFFLLIAFLVLSSCHFFKKDLSSAFNADYVGVWVLKHTEKEPAVRAYEAREEYQQIIRNAFPVTYTIYNDGTYLKANGYEQERGTIHLLNDGKYLQLGALKFEVLSFNAASLKLQKANFIYSFSKQ